MVGWLVNRSVGRLVGRLVGWSVGRLVGRLVGRSYGLLVGRLVGWLVADYAEQATYGNRPCLISCLPNINGAQKDDQKTAFKVELMTVIFK